jgi:multidrug efflux pump subunit AcrA (membrane-fusion protein)
MKPSDPYTIVTVVAVAAIQTWGCVGRADSQPDARTPRAVRLVAVEASTDAESTTYSAVVAPNAQVDLAFRVPGYVVDIRRTKGADGRIRSLEPGAAVSKGLILARIRTTDYQLVVDRAQGSRNESNASVTAAEAQLAEAQAAFTQAESDFARIAALWQQESVTRPVYDGSKARLEAARAKVDAATAGITAAMQRATAAAAQLEEARIGLTDTELHAPFDGILVERHVEIGTLVSPGMPALTVADLHLVKARFSVPDFALDMFSAGQVLPLSVDAYATEPFQGHVVSVAPAAEPKSRAFEIAIAIDNPAMKLRSGMIASIRVARAAAARPLVRIPIDALVHDPTRDQYLVYVVEQRGGEVASVKAVSVRPGALVGNQVSILDGLAAGQRIVASGANLLRPGDAVREIQ